MTETDRDVHGTGTALPRLGLSELAGHAVLALAMLVALTAWVGTAGYFIVDEAALYGQLEALDRGDWVIPVPAPPSGGGGEHVPMALSHVTDDGWAPFAKHPVHVGLAHVAESLAGRFGVRMLSVLGTVAAAVVTASLCRSRAQAVVAFWLTAALSPLVFYSQLVLAHTIGAAVAGLLALVTVVRRPSPWTAIAALSLACIGSMFRNEFLLLGFAFAAVLAARALRRKLGGWEYATAGACAAGSLSAWLLEPQVVSRLIGAEVAATRRPAQAGSSISELGAGAARSLFDLTLDTGGLLQPLSLVMSVVLGFAALVLVRHWPDERAVTGALAVGAVAAAAIHLLEPHVIRGIVFAFPPVLLLSVLRRRDAVATHVWLLAVAGLFAVAVFATQYTLGGGPEWGWRYFIVAVPLLSPALATSITMFWLRRDPSANLAVSGFLLAAALIVLSGLMAQRQTVAETANFLHRTEQVVTETGARKVVFTDNFFGRFNHRLSTEGFVARIEPSNSREYLAALGARGDEPLLLVWPGSGPPPELPLGPYRLTDQTHDLAGVYSGVELELR